MSPEPSAPELRRDLVVIGASAGGISALRTILTAFTPRLPAAVLVVQHLRDQPDGYLAEILGRASRIPVVWADHGAMLEPGRVHVARAGQHLVVERDAIALVPGPRENHARPSINRLFRSAAASFASRTIGVLLTGMLDDGVSGLAAIARSGGVTVVQDPKDAEFPDLPRNAIDALSVDHVLPVASIGPLLATLAGAMIGAQRPPSDVTYVASLDLEGGADLDAVASLGATTALMCPECGGPLWDVSKDGARMYRCYQGHAASPRVLLERKSREVDGALWAAARALRERGMVLGELANDSRRAGREMSAVEFARRSKEALAQAERVREFLLMLERTGSAV